MSQLRTYWRGIEPLAFGATVLLILFGGLYLFLRIQPPTPEPNALDREGVITTTTTTTTTLPPT